MGISHPVFRLTKEIPATGMSNAALIVVNEASIDELSHFPISVSPAAGLLFKAFSKPGIKLFLGKSRIVPNPGVDAPRGMFSRKPFCSDNCLCRCVLHSESFLSNNSCRRKGTLLGFGRVSFGFA